MLEKESLHSCFLVDGTILSETKAKVIDDHFLTPIKFKKVHLIGMAV